MNVIIAIPSKGRLKEQAEDVFAKAGMPVIGSGDQRNYRGRLEGVAGAEVAFLSASEIARELSLGNVHLGITRRRSGA